MSVPFRGGLQIEGHVARSEAILPALYMDGFTHVVRAPGRVNLIGDHTDYNGLPVLPMAIDQAVTLRFRVREDSEVHLRSTHPGAPPAVFRLDEPRRPLAAGDWRNYVLAGSLVLDDPMIHSEGGNEHPASPASPSLGIEGLIDTELPLAAGLSSSSALVVATGLALLVANGRDTTHRGLAEAFARSERFVGTEGGGMDQTASLHGKAGHALRIDFDPIRVRAVPVPDDWCFVVAHSGERAEKSGGAQKVYNARVAACRRALRSLASSPSAHAGLAASSYSEALARSDDRQYWEWALDTLSGDERDCFRHTVSEAQRVVEAERMLRQGDASAFGRLMSASHESLATHYRVSTERLDTLVATAFETGAYGARLTGAGLGGCVVALTDRERADAVEEAMRAQAARWVEAPVAFKAQPSEGARVRAL